MNALLKSVLSTAAAKKLFFWPLRKLGRPLYLTVCVHTERIQDAAVFSGMRELGLALPFRPAACVMTPANPYVKADMERRGVSGEEFLSRLKTLSDSFEIGYHGHYCRPGGAPAPGASTEIERAGFKLTLDDPEALAAQFRSECDYLRSNLYPPEIYSAGWWFMNARLAELLGENGFTADCSLRRARPDTFGTEYLAGSGMSENGKPFILPGSGDVTELPSLFYLHMNWWTVLRELFPLLKRAGGPLFAVLPTHDYNLVTDLEKVLENVRLLAGVPNVQFVSLSKMQELAREQIKK